MDIGSHLRKARQRLSEMAAGSQRTSDIVRKETTTALAPIVKVLDQIKREGYFLLAEDGSRRPFDFLYTPGDFRIQFQVFITGYQLKTGLYTVCFHYGSYDPRFTLTLETHPGGLRAVNKDCSSGGECIERFMELAAENHFLLHD